MFHSDWSFVGDKSVPWDTGCARRFLLISDEERKVLDNIPGWSVVEMEISDKHIPEDGISVPAVEKPLTQLHIADARHKISDARSNTVDAGSKTADAGSNISHTGSNTVGTGSNISHTGSNTVGTGSNISHTGSNTADAGSTNTYNTPNQISDIITKFSGYNCDLPWKENSTITLSEKKHSFMQSISLCANKVVDMFSNIPRKRSNSLSDIHLAKLHDILDHHDRSFSKSETSLNDDSCSHQTSRYVDKVSDESFVSYPFLKYTLPSTGESDNSAHLDIPATRKLWQKEAELLEKRCSRYREMHLKGDIIKQNFTSTLESVEQGLGIQPNVCLPDLVCDKNLTNSYNAAPNKTNSHLSECPQISKVMSRLGTKRIENQKFPCNEKGSEVDPLQDCNEHSRNNQLSAVHDEERLSSIASSPSPKKATKMQKDLMSITVQSIQPKEVVKSNPSVKTGVTQNFGVPPVENSVSESSGITPVESCALQPYEIPFSVSAPPVQSNLINQGETESAMYPKIDYFSKTVVADDVDVHSNVFSVNCSGQDGVNNSGSDKLGGKRKRQSKNDNKPRKKSSLANSLVCIQYTADQVKNMIKIMKKFQTDR